MLSKLVRNLLYYFDVNKGFTFEAASLQAAMRRVLRRGLEINTVIDIGASNGQWSFEMGQYFPHADFLLIEAQDVHRQALEAFVRTHPNANFVMKAAGDAEGTIKFEADGPFAGQVVGNCGGQNVIEVPMTSIDAEVTARNLRGPFLLKFDVHGYETTILRGASETLRSSELIVMECYNFHIGESALLFPEMCRYMDDLGFRVIDFSEPLWRPRDEALWQFDLFFVRKSRAEFQDNKYS